jgi:hypothetical protein
MNLMPIVHVVHTFLPKPPTARGSIDHHTDRWTAQNSTGGTCSVFRRRRQAAPEGLDPLIVLWAACRFIDVSGFPQARVVVRVNVPDMPRLKDLFWLLIQQPEAEVCRKYSGFPDDLVMTTESKWLAQWHMGRISLRAGIRQNVIDIQGAPALIKAFTCQRRSKTARVSPVENCAV